MQKFLKTFLAFALVIAFVNSATAEEFDPLADLYSLDLLTDFEEVNLDVEEFEPLIFEPPPIESKTPYTPAENFEENTTSGSGGAIKDHSVEEAPPIELSIPQTSTPPTLSVENESVPTEIPSYSYAESPTMKLTPTGPGATLLITLFFTFSATWLFRKFRNV